MISKRTDVVNYYTKYTCLRNTQLCSFLLCGRACAGGFLRAFHSATSLRLRGHFLPVRIHSRISVPCARREACFPAATATVRGEVSQALAGEAGALAGEAAAVSDADMEATMISRGPWGACLLDPLRTSRFLLCLPLHLARQRKLLLGSPSRAANALHQPKTSRSTTRRPPHTSR